MIDIVQPHRLGSAAAQRLWRPVSPAIPQSAPTGEYLALRHFSPLFPRRNGPSARAARATKRMRQVSKMPGSEKGEQNRARDPSDSNHIDQVVPGHRKCRGHIGERPVRLCLLAL
jgi:hypothetical protein